MFTTWGSLKRTLEDGRGRDGRRKWNGISQKRKRLRREEKKDKDETPTFVKDPLRGNHIVAKIIRKIKIRSTTTGPPTRVLAMDCEFGGYGKDGKFNCLIRISVVNYDGDVVLDAVVKPEQYVTDFRTEITGLESKDLYNGVEFKIVQTNVKKLLKEDPILVGHALRNDLTVLGLCHKPGLLRDTARFTVLCPKRPKKLKKLAKKYLDIEIQKGSHSSVEDARAALALYRLHETEWEDARALLTNRNIAKRKIKRKKYAELKGW